MAGLRIDDMISAKDCKMMNGSEGEGMYIFDTTIKYKKEFQYSL
jgi:hypothetical protein